MRKSAIRSNVLLTFLGDALRNRRVDIGLTQYELGMQTDLHRTYITDVESGKRNISMLTYHKLTQALKCAVSIPLREAERSIERLTLPPIYGVGGGLSRASALLHLQSAFFADLDIAAFELQVKANMSKLQVAVENYWHSMKIFPIDADQLLTALADMLPINPFSLFAELPTFGSAIDEESATKVGGPLRPGEIEYSALSRGKNYIIRAGGSNGDCLAGQEKGSFYILSGNLRTNNQP